jgi:hypothetical protein
MFYFSLIYSNNNEDSPLIERFSKQPIDYWTLKNMRLYMENFARNQNLDPLLPQTWYTISYDAINQLKVCSSCNYYRLIMTKKANSMIGKFKGDYFQILQRLFPEIGLDVNTFRQYIYLVRLGWQDVQSRRKFFEMYAKKHGFDPLNPENWYSLTYNKILSQLVFKF